MRLILFLILFSCTSPVFAQLPKTEIWVFDIQQTRSGYHLVNPKQIKVGNGYNNQPFFSRDGEKLLFVSNGKKQSKTDIYEYNLRKNRTKRLTRTKNESEYSPQLTPDQGSISCVRVAKDTITQNICLYNLKGKKAKIIFPVAKNIGYYAWRTQVELLSFDLPEPFYLIHRHTVSKVVDTVGSSIGRCIQIVKNHVLFVDKSDSNDWKIKILNPKKLNSRKDDDEEADISLGSTIEGEEDFAIFRGISLFMGHNGVIYQKKNAIRDKTNNANWEALFDLNPYHINKFYRIVISPLNNKLAVVAYSGDKP